MVPHPVGRSQQAAAEEPDVEHVAPVGGLGVGQQVEGERSQPGGLQLVGDELVPRAVAAAAAAVSEDHDADRVRRDGEMTGQREAADPDLHLGIEAGAGTRVGPGTGSGVGPGRGVEPMCPFEEVDDLVVVDLGEVVVPLANRTQPGRLLDAHDLVGVTRQCTHRVGSGDGDRQHHAVRAVGTSDVAGGARRRAGGDAIVDDHGDPAGEIGAGGGSSESFGPALQFLALDLARSG